MDVVSALVTDLQTPRMVLGSHAYKDFVPDEDDVAVERLKEAGAIVLGKTNVPEFGYSGLGHGGGERYGPDSFGQ